MGRARAAAPVAPGWELGSTPCSSILALARLGEVDDDEPPSSPSLLRTSKFMLLGMTQLVIDIKQLYFIILYGTSTYAHMATVSSTLQPKSGRSVLARL
jgi:hypothetical protein